MSLINKKKKSLYPSPITASPLTPTLNNHKINPNAESILQPRNNPSTKPRNLTPLLTAINKVRKENVIQSPCTTYTPVRASNIYPAAHQSTKARPSAHLLAPTGNSYPPTNAYIKTIPNRPPVSQTLSCVNPPIGPSAHAAQPTARHAAKELWGRGVRGEGV